LYTRPLSLALTCLKLMPFGIRWLALQLKIICGEHDMPQEKVRTHTLAARCADGRLSKIRQVLFEFLFDIVFVPAIISPASIGVVAGIKPSRGMRANLQEITKEITRVSVNSSLPEGKIVEDLLQRMIDVEDVEEYYGFLREKLVSRREKEIVTINLTKQVRTTQLCANWNVIF
jgi:hypothetical protein